MIRTGFQLAVFLLVGCVVKNNNTGSMEMQAHSGYYEDVDLFHMRGINEMLPGSINGPYVRIDSIDENRKDIVFQFDEKTVYKKSYKYDGHCWMSFHYVDDSEEGAIFYFYEFVCGDSILELEYKNNPFQDGTLQTVRKIMYGKISEYDLEDDTIRLKPSRDISTYPLGKFIRKRVSSYQIKNGVLSLHRQLIDGTSNEIIRESNDCYVVGKLSYFWWSVAGHKLDKIKCY